MICQSLVLYFQRLSNDLIIGSCCLISTVQLCQVGQRSLTTQEQLIMEIILADAVHLTNTEL